MNNKMISKLRNQAGETIGETLVALLIASLALVMLAGAVSSAANMITGSNAKMAEYYEKDNRLAVHDTADGNITITITCQDDGTLTQTTDPGDPYKYYLNDAFGSTSVVSYAK